MYTDGLTTAGGRKGTPWIFAQPWKLYWKTSNQHLQYIADSLLNQALKWMMADRWMISVLSYSGSSKMLVIMFAECWSGCLSLTYINKWKRHVSSSLELWGLAHPENLPLLIDCQQLGMNARHIAQEHSYVPAMWEKITQPDILIYLNSFLSINTFTKEPLDWTAAEFRNNLSVCDMRMNMQICISILRTCHLKMSKKSDLSFLIQNTVSHKDILVQNKSLFTHSQ